MTRTIVTLTPLVEGAQETCDRLLNHAAELYARRKDAEGRCGAPAVLMRVSKNCCSSLTKYICAKHAPR